MESARGNEQDVIGLHRPVLGRDRRAFDQRQEIALHALARDVGAAASSPRARDLVDLVEEDDAVVLDVVDRLPDDRFVVEQLVGFFGDQQVMRSRATVMRRVLVRPPIALPSRSPRLIMPTARPACRGFRTTCRPVSRTSISISLSLSSPARRRWRKLSRVAGLRGRADQGVEHALLGLGFGLGLDLLALGGRARARCRPRSDRARSARRRGRHSRPR